MSEAVAASAQETRHRQELAYFMHKEQKQSGIDPGPDPRGGGVHSGTQVVETTTTSLSIALTTPGGVNGASA